ncbi:hypothetical protein L3X38_000898 [Prunus dulcis]|uniref:Uncharacterized protein n=1 Tax=Prunus dulcis TaxID=3755 RepID=A0AAD4WRK8_PRUDU|nr:hypothetical protein L3X38_000898 [Prunus dulcis]
MFRRVRHFPYAALDVLAYEKTLYIVWDHHTWRWMFWCVMIQSARVGLSIGATHGVGCEIPHRPNGEGVMCLIWHTSHPSRGGLLGAHWLRVRRNSEVKRVGGWSNPRMGDHPGKLLRELPGTNPCGTLSSGPREDNILLGEVGQSTAPL